MIIWKSWVSDYLILEGIEVVKNQKQIMMTKFDCMDEGPMKEFVGCVTTMSMFEGENARLKFIHPVFIQSLKINLDTRRPCTDIPSK